MNQYTLENNNLPNKNDNLVSIYETIKLIILKHKNKLKEYTKDLNDINEYFELLKSEIKDLEESILSMNTKITENINNIKKISEKIIDYSEHNKLSAEHNELLSKYLNYINSINNNTENDENLIKDINNFSEQFNLIKYDFERDLVDLFNKICDNQIEIVNIINSKKFKNDELIMKNKRIQENKQYKLIIDSIKLHKESIQYWEIELNNSQSKNELYF